MRKKFLLLALMVMALCMAGPEAPAWGAYIDVGYDPTDGDDFGTGWSYDSTEKVFTIDDGAFVTITGDNTGTNNRIVVAPTSGKIADITLENVTIDVSGGTGACAFDMAYAKVDLGLVGNNTLASGENRAGLEVPSGANLTISGPSSLTATGGSSGAGIGGGYSQSGGAVTINVGTVTAIGGNGDSGNGGGAGIGGGGGGTSGGGGGGTVTIKGGTVTAIGGNGDTSSGSGNGAGIGGGGNTSSSGAAATVAVNMSSYTWTKSSSSTGSPSSATGVFPGSAFSNDGSQYVKIEPLPPHSPLPPSYDTDDTNEWYHEYIDYVLVNGVTHGFEGGRFSQTKADRKSVSDSLLDWLFLLDLSIEEIIDIFPSFDESKITVVFSNGTTQTFSDVTLFSGVPKELKLGSETILVCVQLPPQAEILLGTQKTLSDCQKTLDAFGLNGKAVPAKAETLMLDSLLTFHDKGVTCNGKAQHIINTCKGFTVCAYVAVEAAQKSNSVTGQREALLVLGAGLKFTFKMTASGVEITPPKDLDELLKDFSLYKLFSATDVVDLFEVLTPFLDKGIITYSLSPLTNSGTLKIEVTIAVYDGPAPKNNPNVVYPIKGSDYGVLYDPENNTLIIFDGKQDGVISDPIVLARKAKVVPTAVTLTPSSLSLKKGESKTVTAAFTPANATERDLIWTESLQGVAEVTAAGANEWIVKGLAPGVTTLTATSAADAKVKAGLSMTVLPELIETLTVTPLPPYREGEKIEILATFNGTPTSVTVSVKQPDGTTDEPKVTIGSNDAMASVTLPKLGDYTVTLTATDGAASETKTASITVTEGGANSSGGCNAGVGIFGLLAVMWVGLRRK